VLCHPTVAANGAGRRSVSHPVPGKEKKSRRGWVVPPVKLLVIEVARIISLNVTIFID
jgi:hypothetical protein